MRRDTQGQGADLSFGIKSAFPAVTPHRIQQKREGEGRKAPIGDGQDD